MNITILRFDSVESTNSVALEQAKRGGEEGLCIVAREQTGGRGRLGRKWISEKDAGLYFSIILRPKIATKFLPLLTLMSGVVVFDVLQKSYELEPDIKWSNDVLVNGKKISGILAETAETKNGLAVIVGIGINLHSRNFTPDLSKIATSVEQETLQKPDREDLINSLTHFFAYFYSIFQSDNGPRTIRDEWAKRSSYFDGKIVRVNLGNNELLGTTCGLDKNGALKIKTQSGETKVIRAGDVESIRNI